MLLCLVEKLLMPSEKLIIEKLQNETSSLVKMLLQCKLIVSVLKHGVVTPDVSPDIM